YNGGSPIWRNLAANGLYANFLDINPNTSATNLYLRADNEVRITKRNTTDSYIPIRAASATWTSSERYKYDIEDWNIDVLDHLVNRIKLYSYKLYSEQDDESDRIRHGVILERETPDEWKNGDGVDSYEMTAWSIKAIQELAKKVQILEAKSEEK
ncbi:tail fiber domain-containing protein, partial [Mammaliicoccus vitulinus]